MVIPDLQPNSKDQPRLAAFDDFGNRLFIEGCKNQT